MNKLLLYCLLFFAAVSFPACFPSNGAGLEEPEDTPSEPVASTPSTEEVDDKPVQSPLYFTTFNSLRYVSFSKRTITIGYGEEWNLFSLTPFQYFLFSTDHERGIQKYDLKYSPYGSSNEAPLFSELEKATDHQYNEAGEAFFASNYNIYKVSNDKLTPYPEASLIKAPFSLAIKGNYLWIAGRDELSVTNLKSNRSKIVHGHGMKMAGYVCFDEHGAFYVTDTEEDAVKMLSPDQVTAVEQALDPEQTTLSASLKTLSKGNMLMDPNQSEKRGPIGIDYAKGLVWVAVDAGTKIPGRIVTIDPKDGTQKLYLDGLPGPRAIIIADR